MTGEPTPTPADGDTPVTESGPSAPVAPSGTPAGAGDSGGIRGFLDAHHDLSKMVREARRFSINLPLIGKVAVPQPKQLAFYGVLAGLAAAGAIEWPVAVTLGLGVAVTTRAQQSAAPPRQPALTAGPTVITAPSVVVVEAETHPPAIIKTEIIETDEPNVAATTDDSPAATKPAPKKTPQKRAPAKKASAQKVPAKRSAAHSGGEKKVPGKKGATKKTVAKKIPAKKAAPATKRAPVKKSATDETPPE